VFVEHWHWWDTITTSNSGTMTIRQNHLSGAPSATLYPTGYVLDTAPGSLPGCIGSDSLVTSCGQVQNNWVYYDFPTTCNNPVDYTLLSGGTVVLQEGCGNLYPANIQGTFSDTAPPAIKIDGNDCQGYIVNADTCSGSLPVAVTWTVAAQDDCDPSPDFVSSSKISGSTFGLGYTPVTVTYKDNTEAVATCTFNVNVNECASAAPSKAPTTPPSFAPSTSPQPSPAPSSIPSDVPSASAARIAFERGTVVVPSDAPSVSAVPSDVPSCGCDSF